MGYYGLNTFDEVAKRYMDTKPLRGKRASEDIRPLGTGFERRYTWKRIIRINENKYVLNDGNNIFWANNTLQYEDTAPIVWERKDGRDYITIRNNWNNGSAVSRYKFLQQWLPKSMNFTFNQQGKHYVVYKGELNFLPKPILNVDWGKKIYTVERDSKIVYEERYGEFIRANELQPFVTRRKDKALIAEYEPKIEEFWIWMQIMLPILGDMDYDKKATYANKLCTTGIWYWKKYTPQEKVREALNNPESEYRVALAVCCADEIGAYKSGTTGFTPKPDSLQKLKELMRKIAGLYVVELK